MSEWKVAPASTMLASVAEVPASGGSLKRADRHEPVRDGGVGRRDMFAKLLGAGAVAALAGCARDSGAIGEEATHPLSGAGGSFDTVIGTTSGVALKATTGTSDGQTVVVDGYETVGDGGGGVFMWSTGSATDDGGTIIVPTGGSNPGAHWKRIFAGAVNVKWFGAKGDGSTSDTTAFDKAFAALSSASGVAVYVPGVQSSTGAYVISSSLNVSRNNVTLYGDGAASRIKNGGITTTVLEFTGSGTLIHDITLDVNTSTNGVVGVKLTGHEVAVQDCVFENTASSLPARTYGIYAPGAPSTTNTDPDPWSLRVARNRLKNCSIAAGGSGSRRRLVSITDNIIETPLGDGISLLFGRGSTAYGAQDVAITGNIIKGATLSGINIGYDDTLGSSGTDYLKRLLIAQNVIDGFAGNAGVCIIASATTEDLTIANNIIRGNTTAGMYGVALVSPSATTTVKQVRIVGNLIEQTDTNLIIVSLGTSCTARGIDIVGNQARGGRGFHVEAGNLRDVRIEQNRVDEVTSGCCYIKSLGDLYGRVVGNIFKNVSNPGSSSMAVQLVTNSSTVLDLKIRENFMTDDQTTKTQEFAIFYVNSGTMELEIVGNDFRGNSDFAIYPRSGHPSGWFIKQNRGWTLEQGSL